MSKVVITVKKDKSRNQVKVPMDTATKRALENYEKATRPLRA